jgi:ribosomal protein S18 acetylase RimI-like enzyme
MAVTQGGSPPPAGGTASHAGRPAQATVELTSVDIADIRTEQIGAGAGALADSLTEDPVYSHLFPDRSRRRRVLRLFLQAAVRDALPFGMVHGASRQGRVLGAAVWLPAGRARWSLARKLRASPAMLGILLIAPRSFHQFVRFGGNVEHALPAEPFMYLEVVGVEPAAQGSGIGARLLQPGLARADRERLPCYLETPTERNVRFYERLGFQVERSGVQFAPDGPTHFTMRRPARTP